MWYLKCLTRMDAVVSVYLSVNGLGAGLKKFWEAGIDVAYLAA